jgi:hypothetical protein
MTDPREALVRVTAWLDDDADLRIPDTPWGRALYDDLRLLVAGWSPPTVKPSVEDVARRHSRVSMDGTCVCGAVGIGFILGYGEHLVAETLALFPGRTEVEVHREAEARGYEAGYRRGYRDRRLEKSFNPHQEEADDE